MDIKLPIEEFSKAQKKDKAQEFYSKTLEIILNTLEDMKDEGRLNFFNEETTRIFPMGDYTNNTFIDENGIDEKKLAKLLNIESIQSRIVKIILDLIKSDKNPRIVSISIIIEAKKFEIINSNDNSLK